MKKIANRVKVAIATTGTGTITFGAAANPYLAPGDVGFVNGDVVSYVLTDGNDFEEGFGTIGGSVTTLSRDTVRISKIGGTVGTTKLTLSGAAVMFIAPSAEDLMFDQTHGADIASASTLNLETSTGGFVHVTGTTTITAVTLLEGHVRWVKFSGACLITVGSSLVGNAGGNSVTTAAGDMARFVGDASGVVYFTLFRASGITGIPLAVFPVTGQSNGQGQGDSTQSPAVPVVGGVAQVLAYKYDGTIVAANDPVPNAYSSGNGANTGSAWPSFGSAFYAAKNIPVMFVVTAIGGTGQFPVSGDSGNNWDAAGNLIPAAITAINAALAAAAAAGYAPFIAGILHWDGEKDANNVNSSLETQAQYVTSLQGGIAAWRAATLGGVTYPELPFYIFKTGTNLSNADLGYATVRAGQEQVAAGDLLTKIVTRNSYAYTVAGGLGYHLASPNAVHLNQTALNLSGALAAANVVAAQSKTGLQPSGTSLDLFYDQGNVVIGWGVSSGALFSVNNSGAPAPTPFSGAISQVIGPASSAAVEDLVSYGSGGVRIIRTSLGSPTAQTKVTSGTTLAAFSCTGYDAVVGWGTKGNASIAFDAAEDWNDATHHGTRLRLRTTPNATDTPTDRLIINNDGTAQLVAYTTAGSLSVDGSGNVKSNAFFRGSSSSSNPTGVTSTSAFLMMGIAFPFTPGVTGTMLFTLSGNANNSVAGSGFKGRIYYGTGTAPANGAAVAGTQAGGGSQGISVAAGSNCNATIIAIVTGLTPGVTYWLDAAIEAITSGTAEFLPVQLSAIEL